MSKTCKEYTCITCINGTCPVAVAEEHEYYDVPTIKNCDECFFNNGCEDCFWNPQSINFNDEDPNWPICDNCERDKT